MHHIQTVSTNRMRSFITIQIILVLLSTSCQTSRNMFNFLDEKKIAFSREDEGIYIYDINKDEVSKIVDLKRVFLNNSIQFLNDSVLIVGYRGELKDVAINVETGDTLICPCSSSDSLILKGIVRSDKYTHHEKYHEYYISINLNTKKYYPYKTVEYSYINRETLRVDTTIFDFNGVELTQKDTSFSCNSASYSYDRVEYCNTERYFSKSNIVNDRYIYSRQGDLILSDNGNDTIILKFNGYFDPKFGSGYFQPYLSKKGDKVLYRKLSGFQLFGDKGKLFEMYLKTKETTLLLDKSCYKPQYSKNGDFILYSRDGDIYVMNIEKRKEVKIRKGKYFCWK